MEQSGANRDPLVSEPDTGAPARGGWLPFHLAILTVVVGLLLVTCAFLIGKQLDARIHPARLLRLGAGGAELESEALLAVFAPLQVLLPTDPANGEWEALDGKVIAISEGDGVRTALVRFTGIGWEARERTDAFAA
jgi:hypothetical protein